MKYTTNNNDVLQVEPQEAKVFIETERVSKQQISPMEKLVRNEVVKWFSFLVKTEPTKKLEDLISIAKDDIKNQLINICYNL